MGKLDGDFVADNDGPPEATKPEFPIGAAVRRKHDGAKGIVTALYGPGSQYEVLIGGESFICPGTAIDMSVSEEERKTLQEAYVNGGAAPEPADEDERAIQHAGDMAEFFGYDQIIVFGRRTDRLPDEPGFERLTTNGASAEHRDIAARAGFMLQAGLMKMESEFASQATRQALREIKELVRSGDTMAFPRLIQEIPKLVAHVEMSMNIEERYDRTQTEARNALTAAGIPDTLDGHALSLAKRIEALASESAEWKRLTGEEREAREKADRRWRKCEGYSVDEEKRT